MASTVKRFAAGAFAVWFSLWSVIFPVTAHAAIYDAASNLTGKVWYVPGVGTSVAGNRVLAAGATMLGRANPWIAAITIGMPIAQTILELRNGTNPVTPEGLPLPPEASFAPSPATLPVPPGWNGPDSPPLNETPASGEAGPNLGETTPATQQSRPVSTGYSALMWIGGVSRNIWYSSLSDMCARQREVAYPTANLTGMVDSGTGSYAYCVYDKPYANYQAAVYRNVSSCGGEGLDVSTSACTYYQCDDPLFTLNLNVCTRTGCPDGSPVLVDGTCYSSPTCPAGYTLNYDSCILSENAPFKVKWPSGTNGNVPAFVPDPANPGEWKPFERNSPAGTPSDVTAEAIRNAVKNAINSYTQDQYGNPTSQQLTPNAQGGLTYQQQVQTTNGTQTTTTTNTFTLNQAGNVTNASTVTNNGPITNVSNTYSSSTNVDIPNDYNKEVTQAKILSGEGAPDAPDYETSLATKTENLTKGITDLLDPITGQYSDDKNKWFSWVWTPPVGNCSPITGTVHNKSVTWDICPYVEMVRNAIGWIFSIVGAWVIYNNMFRREE